MYPEKIIIQKDTCALMFTETVFTITRAWKQPKCSSTDEQIKKCGTYKKREYYSAIKRNKFESTIVRQMKLEPVIQWEVSQKKKNNYRKIKHTNGNYK